MKEITKSEDLAEPPGDMELSSLALKPNAFYV